MRLEWLTAIPHPDGNRIDLRWKNPAPEQYPGVRVVRREASYPTAPDDGVCVAQGEGLQTATDSRLKGETVYYYSLFVYKTGGDPLVYDFDPANRTAAMATASYNMAEKMYHLLPGISQRYDALQDAARDGTEEASPGQLRRFLDLPGGQLDQLYSLARGLLQLQNLDKVDGRLLPWLAHWIGWQTDYRREIATQRHELRYAPFVYPTIGTIPNMEAAVKRAFDRDICTKEFMHNIFFSNRPERLNLWRLNMDSNGTWAASGQLFSVDFAYEGRPTCACTEDGTQWLFYHTLRNNQWQIWYKTRSPERDWNPSQPLPGAPDGARHPSAAVVGATLWVFWDVYDETSQAWHIDFCTRTSQGWSAVMRVPDLSQIAGRERRWPWAVVATETNELWLFWLERVGAQLPWRLTYGGYNGTDWILAAALPDEVESAPFVLYQPPPQGTTSPPRLWVFWARREPPDALQRRRWTIVYRRQERLIALREAITEEEQAHWGEAQQLPAGVADGDDREPAAWINAAGQVALVWSSNREGGWSLWHSTFQDNWSSPQQRTAGPYSQRDPLIVPDASGTMLLYRSNESLIYRSQVYTATTTRDHRYAGCTTVDTRNAAKIALHGQLEDFQTYTYDTGQPGRQPWYERDTVGLYVAHYGADQARLARDRALLENLLRQFLPMQVRAVFILAPTISQEWVYTYDAPAESPPRLIQEQWWNRLHSTPISETYAGVRDTYQDTVPDWEWLRTWSKAAPAILAATNDTKFRTWHIGVQAGG